MKELSNKKGGSTLELLVAFSIISMFIVAMVLITFGNQGLLLDSEMSVDSLQIAIGLLEEIKKEALDDFANINSKKYEKEKGYDKELFVKQTNFWTKEVSSKISWDVNGKKAFSDILSVVVNKSGFDGGDTCYSSVSGDWKNFAYSDYEFGKDLVFDEKSEFLISDIDVRNKKMYVSIENSTLSNSATFFVFDLNADHPNFIVGVDNNPKTKSGFNAMHIGSRYAYLASSHKSNFTTCEQGPSCSQLQIVDLENNMFVSRTKMPGVIGSGGQAVGNSIFYKNGLVYLGLSKSDVGPEFHIIDVGNGIAGGSASNPVYLSGFNIGNGVNKIFVKGDYAFIASPNEEELKILNIKDPFNIYKHSGLDASGGKNNFGNGKSVVSVGDRVYLGRTLLSDGDEFYIFDMSGGVPILPSLKSFNILNSNKNNVSVNDIIIKNAMVFLLTNNDLRIFEEENERFIYSFPSGFSAKDMDCEADTFYISYSDNNSKSFITIIKPI